MPVATFKDCGGGGGGGVRGSREENGMKGGDQNQLTGLQTRVFETERKQKEGSERILQEDRL